MVKNVYPTQCAPREPREKFQVTIAFGSRRSHVQIVSPRFFRRLSPFEAEAEFIITFYGLLPIPVLT
jgi:hypothetical protein